MKLRKITFVLENCDYIEIDGKYVCSFLVDDIKTKFCRTACNSIDRFDIAKTFAIEICKDANKERYQFGQNQVPDLKQLTFNRLEYSDITSIEFELIDEYVNENSKAIEKHCYYVDWTGDSDTSNDSQTSYISDLGNLYIVIAEGKKISDFFDEEYINDSKAIDFRFMMCDVGDKCNLSKDIVIKGDSCDGN